VDYKPFIKDPEISLDKTTRLLRNRYQGWHLLCLFSWFNTLETKYRMVQDYDVFTVHIHRPGDGKICTQ
jgi:hypothetical protein